MFKRPARSALTRIRQSVIPPGGWIRAIRYNRLRLLRIPDDPRRIAIGVFVGTFVAFTPFFGAHFLLAPFLAWAAGGSVPASLLATMICNPLSFPIIAYSAVYLGNWLLQTENAVDKSGLEDAFKTIWRSIVSGIRGGDSDWSTIASLFEQVFLPYLAGGSLMGIAAAVFASWLAARAVSSYRELRRRRDGRAERKRNVT